MNALGQAFVRRARKTGTPRLVVAGLLFAVLTLTFSMPAEAALTDNYANLQALTNNTVNVGGTWWAKDTKPNCRFRCRATGSGNSVAEIRFWVIYPLWSNTYDIVPDTTNFDRTMVGPYDAVINLTALPALQYRYDISYRQNRLGVMARTYSEYFYLDSVAPTGLGNKRFDETEYTLGTGYWCTHQSTITCRWDVATDTGYGPVVGGVSTGCGLREYWVVVERFNGATGTTDWTGTMTSTGLNAYYVLPSAQILDGCRYRVHVYADDNLGNQYDGGWSQWIWYDGTAPTGSISINSGAMHTGVTSVTLGLTATDPGYPPSGVSQMQFNDGSGWTAWEAFASTKAWTLQSGTGTKTVQVQFRDNVGNVSLCWNTIYLDQTAPQNGAVTINGGAAYTSNPTATLALFAEDTPPAGQSGMYQMRITNTDGSNWTTVAYATTYPSWNLELNAAGDGLKTVYARFSDQINNWTTTSVYGTITLDRTPPTSCSVVIDGGAAETNTAAVTLTLSAVDSLSGVTSIRVSNDGSTWTTDTYAATYPWTLAAGEGSRTVYVQFQNGAGVWSDSVTDDIHVDTTPPTGGIVINGNSPYTQVTGVTLTMSATGAAFMRISNTDGNEAYWSSLTPIAYQTSYPWTLTSGDGEKVVYARFRDTVGNWTTTSENDSITLDTTPPTGSVIINSDAAATNSLDVLIRPTATDAGSAPSQMRFSNDGSTWSTWEAYASVDRAWTLAAGADGTRRVYAQYVDNAGNAVTDTSIFDEIIYDTTPPTISVPAGAFADDEVTPLSRTKNGPAKFSVTYGGYSTISLNSGHVQVTATGTAAVSTISISGTGDTRWVRLSGISGDGTIQISIAASSAVDNAGNPAPVSGASATFVVDNTAPTGSIGAPSATLTRTGPVSFVATYTGADFVDLKASDVTLSTSGTANGTVAIQNGNTTTPTVVVENVTGDGHIGIQVGPNVAWDTAGNYSAALAASAMFEVDNTAPGVSVGAPSASITRTGPISYTVTYSGAQTVDLEAGDIALNTTGTATGAVSVLNGATSTPTVVIDGTTGDGTIGFTIAAGTAVDAAGNAAGGATSATFTVDNTAPTFVIGPPSPSVTGPGPATFTVTYSNFSAITLASTDVSVETLSGDAAVSTINVLPGAANSRVVELSGITGDGEVRIAIASGTASDIAGNLAAGGTSEVLLVNNTNPTVSFGTPSPMLTRNGPVTCLVYYAVVDYVTLTATDVILNKTGTANGTVSVEEVEGEPLQRMVVISGITGDGTLSVSVPDETAVPLNPAFTVPAAGPSAAVTVDNTPPSVAVGTPSIAKTNTGPVSFVVTYTDVDDVSLTPQGITQITTGDCYANSVSVAPSGKSTQDWVVTLSNTIGNGTLSIRVQAGTATDLAGNTAGASPASATFVVDNTPPGMALAGPSTYLTNSGPVTYRVNYTDAASVTLSSSNVTLVKTGTADAMVSVSGTGLAQRTITLFNLTGDGTLGVQVAAGTAADDVGNLTYALAGGPTDVVAVDNTKPVISLLGVNPIETEWTLPYADAGATATDTHDGSLTHLIVVSNPVNTLEPGTYSVTYNVTDHAGNAADEVVRTVNVFQDPTEKRILCMMGGEAYRDFIKVTILPGMLYCPSGSLRIELDRALNFDISGAKATVEENRIIVGTCYSVKPFTTWNDPLGTVEIWYPDADQNGYVDGTPVREDTIFMVRINGQNSVVERVAATTNTASNSLTANIETFGTYALAGLFVEEELPTPTVAISGPWLARLMSPVTLTAVVTNMTGQIAYEWYRDGQILPFYQGPTLHIPNVAMDDAGDYRVVVFDESTKARFESPIYHLEVTDEDLPMSGLLGVGLAALGCALSGCRILRRRK